MRISKEQVLSVYSGIDGKCCCGCSGKHYYHSNQELRSMASKERGYEVTEEECSDKMINKIVKIINEAKELEDDMSSMKTAIIGNRVYIAYLK